MEGVQSALERGQVCGNSPNNLDLLCSPDYSCRKSNISLRFVCRCFVSLHTHMHIHFLNDIATHVQCIFINIAMYVVLGAGVIL